MAKPRYCYPWQLPIPFPEYSNTHDPTIGPGKSKDTRVIATETAQQVLWSRTEQINFSGSNSMTDWREYNDPEDQPRKLIRYQS